LISPCPLLHKKQWRRGKNKSQSKCFGSGFSLSSTLFVEERAGRGGLVNIAFAFNFLLLGKKLLLIVV
jgi:hypothetical protein